MKNCALILKIQCFMLLVGCNLSPQTSPQSNPAKEIVEDAATEAEVVTNTDSKYVAKLDSTTKQTITPSTAGALKGTVVTFQPNALAVSTEITVQEGQALASDTSSTDFNLPTEAEVSKASTPVFIEPAEKVDPTTPFSLSLALDDSAALAAADQHLIILYKVTKYAENKSYTGVILPDAYTKDGTTVTFDASFFGIYQLAYSTVEVTTAVTEKNVEEAPKTKEAAEESTDTSTSELSPEKEAVQGKWIGPCFDSGPTSTIRGNVGGKEYEFNAEDIVFDAVGTYTVGDGDFEVLDLENDWIDANIKASKGTITVTEVTNGLIVGTYNLSSFVDDHSGEAFTGSIAGTFSVFENSQQGQTNTFTAIGTGDLAVVQISDSSAEYEEEEASRRFEFHVTDSEVKAIHREFFAHGCSSEPFFVSTAVTNADAYEVRDIDKEGGTIAAQEFTLTVTKHLFQWGSDAIGQMMSGCGVSTQSGVDFDVTGATDCGGIPFYDKDEVFYNFYRIEKDTAGTETLYVGHYMGSKSEYPAYFWEHMPMVKTP